MYSGFRHQTFRSWYICCKLNYYYKSRVCNSMQSFAIICNFNQEMITLLSHVRVKQATSRFSLYISSQRVSNGLRETPNSGEEAIRSNCCFKSSALTVNGKYLHFIEGSQLIQSLYAIPYLKALGLPVHICTFL